MDLNNSLAFIDYYKGDKVAFANKVITISKRLGINPNWLMFVMWSESSMNPQAQNKKYLVQGQPATGLIQFVKSTAQGLGTSIPALFAMTGLEQLDYVEKYFKAYTGKLKSFIDVYFAVFFPNAIGKAGNYILQTKNIAASNVARSNPIFDLNKDHIITVDELKEAMLKRIPSKFVELVSSTGGKLAGLLLLFGIGVLLYSKYR